MHVFVAAVVEKWQNWHFKFRKVVHQHMQGLVGNMKGFIAIFIVLNQMVKEF